MTKIWKSSGLTLFIMIMVVVNHATAQTHQLVPRFGDSAIQGFDSRMAEGTIQRFDSGMRNSMVQRFESKMLRSPVQDFNSQMLNSAIQRFNSRMMNSPLSVLKDHGSLRVGSVPRSIRSGDKSYVKEKRLKFQEPSHRDLLQRRNLSVSVVAPLLR